MDISTSLVRSGKNVSYFKEESKKSSKIPTKKRNKKTNSEFDNSKTFKTQDFKNYKEKSMKLRGKQQEKKKGKVKRKGCLTQRNTHRTIDNSVSDYLNAEYKRDSITKTPLGAYLNHTQTPNNAGENNINSLYPLGCLLYTSPSPRD